MSRTYVKGRDSFKRVDCKHGHCYYCGYDTKISMQRKTEKKNVIKKDIIPLLEFFTHPEKIPYVDPYDV